MCTMHVSGPHGDKERVLNLLSLELQAVVSRPVRAGTVLGWSSGRVSNALNLSPSLAPIYQKVTFYSKYMSCIWMFSVKSLRKQRETDKQ